MRSLRDRYMRIVVDSGCTHSSHPRREDFLVTSQRFVKSVRICERRAHIEDCSLAKQIRLCAARKVQPRCSLQRDPNRTLKPLPALTARRQRLIERLIIAVLPFHLGVRHL